MTPTYFTQNIINGLFSIELHRTSVTPSQTPDPRSLTSTLPQVIPRPHHSIALPRPHSEPSNHHINTHTHSHVTNCKALPRRRRRRLHILHVHATVLVPEPLQDARRPEHRRSVLIWRSNRHTHAQRGDKTWYTLSGRIPSRGCDVLTPCINRLHRQHITSSGRTQGS